MIAIILGLAVIGVAAWIWSSRRVHDYLWDAVERGPHLPGNGRPRTRSQAVVGIRLAAAVSAVGGAFLVFAGFGDALFW
jgi:hypothetical protein